jgi:hypothetical protein
MNQNNLYPYLMPGLISPAQEEITLPLGHGVRVMLFEDHEAPGGIVHSMLMPDALKASGLEAGEAHRIALENLQRWFEAAWVAEEEVLSMKMIGNPGDEWNFLLFSGHARAAACLRLPDLYLRSKALLRSDALCACVPQRESLIVLPQRDRRYREALIARVRQIEADARRPISFELFELTREGVQPFAEEQAPNA